MPDLSTYTGSLPNPFATRFIEMLEAEGFNVAPTRQGPRPDQRKTLRITWRGIYIGQMRDSLWARKIPCACLYMFADEDRFSIAKAPPGFNKDEFARQNNCDTDLLRVESDNSGSYLLVQDVITSLHLMRKWAEKIDEVFYHGTDNRDVEQIHDDVLTILANKSLSETERLAEVSTRLGQGQFRANLEQEFGQGCASTGLAILPALRASHIVPWRNSNGLQRLDPKNGLLLSANIDALFDRYMITFKPDGKLVISKSVTQHDLDRLGPIHDLRILPCESRGAYLKLHNMEFERLEEERLEYMRKSNRYRHDSANLI